MRHNPFVYPAYATQLATQATNAILTLALWTSENMTIQRF